MKTYLKSWANRKNSQWHSGIVVPEHKLVMMYALKSGCSTIKRMFLDDLGYGPGKQSSSSLLNLHTAKQIHEKCKDYLKIGIVRNPYDRIASAWYEKTRKKNFKDFCKFGLYHGISFGDFVKKVFDYNDMEIDRHLKSQVCFMCYPDLHVLPDYIYKLEELDNKWPEIIATVSDWTNGNFIFPCLRHDNRSDSKNRIEWTAKLRELINIRYSNDFTVFNYSRIT